MTEIYKKMLKHFQDYVIYKTVLFIINRIVYQVLFTSTSATLQKATRSSENHKGLTGPQVSLNLMTTDFTGPTQELI